MRLRLALWCAFIGFVHFVSPHFARAQFNCGSTGARGALVVNSGPAVILDVPDDGIFHFTTITISGTLDFRRNAAFNPPAILLATGDVTINPGGTVRVNGSSGTTTTGGFGGPGGFDGGEAGVGGGSPGAGHGPGAGGPGTGPAVGGNASYGGDPLSNHPADGVPYGSPLLVPLAGGSGGGGDETFGGDGGGGALLVCSPTRVIVNGTVQAIGGGTRSSSTGSGGAIRIISPFVGGTGSVNVSGGAGWGGHGRVRVDLIDRSGFTLSFQPPSSLSVGSFMSVFPSSVPRLDVVQVAGNDIAPGTPSPLVFTLPFNSPASQSITVRATGFLGQVGIAVVVTPASGERIVAETEIDMDVSNEATVNVDLPQNVVVRIHAWTR